MKQSIPFLLLLFLSCKRDFPNIPEGIIASEKMKLILVDLHVADALAETKGQKGENEKMLAQIFDERVFENFRVSKQEFLKSYHFYEDNPILLNKMYDEILIELSKREEKTGKR
jgi:hypothetical protein